MIGKFFILIFLSFLAPIQALEDKELEETFGPEMLKMVKSEEDQNHDSSSDPLNQIPDVTQSSSSENEPLATVNIESEIPDVIKNKVKTTKS